MFFNFKKYIFYQFLTFNFKNNPELGHILNDPELIRQTMEMMRNPNMFQELMRNHDQAIRNLQVFIFYIL